MDKKLEARALEINKHRQRLQQELQNLADVADVVAGDIQEVIDDNEDVDEDDLDPDFDLQEHEAAYSSVTEWQEALEQAANLLDL